MTASACAVPDMADFRTLPLHARDHANPAHELRRVRQVAGESSAHHSQRLAAALRLLRERDPGERERLSISSGLHVEQLCVRAAARDERCMCPFFDHLAAREHDNAIGHSDRRESVGYDDRHPAGHEFIEPHEHVEDVAECSECRAPKWAVS